jgi:hypothetical protein
MNPEDWAIVVGINSYPGIINLQGPENDAQHFYDWLVSPIGGGIQMKSPHEKGLSTDNHAILVKSSDFTPPSTKVSTAKPTQAEVEEAFDFLYDLAQDNLHTKGRSRIGRRLYLYFSGHGFVPSFGVVPSPDDAALLMANSAYKKPGYHISGRPYAHWFFNAGIFQEIILLMDCCRDNNPNYPPNTVPYNPMTGTAADLANRRSFFGFGTKWNRQSRERLMGDGKWHGVFTTALLAGLNGAAVDVDSGNVTAKTLGNYLYNYMKFYFTDLERNDPTIEKEPSLAFEPAIPDDRIVLSKPSPDSVKFPVAVNLSADLLGQQIQIIGERKGQKNLIIDSTTAVSPVWNCRVEPGLYTLHASGGKEQTIEIIGYTSADNKSVGKVKKIDDEKEADYVDF